MSPIVFRAESLNRPCRPARAAALFEPPCRAVRALLILLSIAGAVCLSSPNFALAQAETENAPAETHAEADAHSTAEDSGHELHAADEAHAEGHDDHAGGHIDPVANVLLAIVIILLLAKVGGDLFERVGMPAVLGELVIGILIGNAALITGWHGFDFFHAPPESQLGDPYSAGAVLKMLAGIGVVLLLVRGGTRIERPGHDVGRFVLAAGGPAWRDCPDGPGVSDRPVLRA